MPDNDIDEADQQRCNTGKRTCGSSQHKGTTDQAPKRTEKQRIDHALIERVGALSQSIAIDPGWCPAVRRVYTAKLRHRVRFAALQSYTEWWDKDSDP